MLLSMNEPSGNKSDGDTFTFSYYIQSNLQTWKTMKAIITTQCNKMHQRVPKTSPLKLSTVYKVFHSFFF